MNGHDLLDAIGGIDPKYIIDADKKIPKHNKLIRFKNYYLAAAGLLLLVIAGIVIKNVQLTPYYESVDETEEIQTLQAIPEGTEAATPISDIVHILEKVDMVLVMTVNPGFGGQSLIPYTLDKVRELSVLARQKKLKIDIEVDGGINMDTIEDVLEAGANIIVAGSAVFNGDIKSNTEALLAKME